MRRQLLHSWPVLAQLYGIHPWDVYRLSIDELNEYITHANEQTRRRG